MRKLTEDLNTFFYSSINGLELFLSKFRIQNKQLITKVFNCLMKEKSFTDQDIEHLRNFKKLTNSIQIPEFVDVKSLISTEAYLNESNLDLSKKDLRYLLEYLFFLFCRHKEIKADLQSIRHELYLWRLIERFHILEQNILVNYVYWLKSKEFSEHSISNSLSELKKFCLWIQSQDLDLEMVNNEILKGYLSGFSLTQKSSSKQKILCNLKPFFSFYKEEINPSFRLPSMTIEVKRNKLLYNRLSSQDIEKLKEAIRKESQNLNGALMLYLLIEFGVPLKCLSLIEIQGKSLIYVYRCQARTGKETKQIRIRENSLLEYLISQQKRDKHSKYLFQNLLSSRKNKPVSVDYCQSTIQKLVLKALGFEIPVQVIYRDCLKHRAKHKRLTEFIDETIIYPYRNKTKLFYWLNGK